MVLIGLPIQYYALTDPKTGDPVVHPGQIAGNIDGDSDNADIVDNSTGVMVSSVNRDDTQTTPNTWRPVM